MFIEITCVNKFVLADVFLIIGKSKLYVGKIIVLFFFIKLLKILITLLITFFSILKK